VRLLAGPKLKRYSQYPARKILDAELAPRGSIKPTHSLKIIVRY
jgi:hypothetical protein